jgi:hypothetical protein
MVWASKLVDMGVLQDGDKEKLVELAVAGAIVAGTSTWSAVLVPLWRNRIWPWILEKTEKPNGNTG